jgi:phosphatidylglycerol---prolipoprotein diacylglyceryl transferase
VPSAVIQLNFDPYLRVDGQAVRWEIVAVAAVIFLALLLAAQVAGRAPTRFADGRSFRRDDLLFIALGIIPGAVLGGRLTYVLVHLDYYLANPGSIVDPSSGGLALTGAVVLGSLTGMYVARLLDAPIGRWLDLAAVSLLIGLGLGKLSEVLGGSGQGLISSVSWATAYVGPGPWGVLGPELPAHPAQVYEALGDGLVLASILVIGRVGPFRVGDGRRFLVAVGGWSIVRFIVVFWWRDAPVAGPLRAEQLLDLGLLLIVALLLVVIVRRPATIEETTSSRTPPTVPTGALDSTAPREDAP